jgi:4-amino-4-deoxy-L-arabinose transferase-like glycosyltransferase
VAAAIAMLTLVAFFIAPQQPEMAPEEYLRRNLGSGGTSLSWLLPLLYVLLALTLVAWAGARHSNRTRRGRALFLFTIGIALIVLASAFFLLRAAGSTRFVGVGAAATLLGCAMLVVASGSLLPSVEDWFGARRELRIIQPLLHELNGRHPNIGIGVRPRGPLLFRVAEQMSLISDALYLEATRTLEGEEAFAESSDPARLSVSPEEQARRIAEWIIAGRGSGRDAANSRFPGPNWLRQPSSYSDREWILAIADQYRTLARGADVAAT